MKSELSLLFLFSKNRKVDHVNIFDRLYNFRGNTCFRLGAIQSGKCPWMDISGGCGMEAATHRQIYSSDKSEA